MDIKEKYKIRHEKYLAKHKRYNDSAKGKEVRNKWALALRKEVIEHYGGKCAYCGQDRIEFLCLDHIDNGRGNPADRSHGAGKVFYSWVKRNNYPTNLQVLCHNCNMAKELYNIKPSNNNH